MIKCPNCGSTAQVKPIGQVWGENTAIRKFRCGCGCEFLRYYSLRTDLCKVITKEGEKRK
jgi:hypothetical protein